ncbi:MAG: protein-L-isoaspartate(D-aspartate) O-methyltransferase [Rhodoferax sp.]
MHRDSPPPKPRPAFPVRLDLPVVRHQSNAPKVMRAPQALALGVGLDSAAVRRKMVRKLCEQGLTDARVIQAFETVERHRFVDTALVNQAYEDTSLPIGLGQTISKPGVVARMLALLLHDRAQPLSRVLEIGSGCGYQAALLAQLANTVVSIERLQALHEKAQQNLASLGLQRIRLVLGDGCLGYAPAAPYDGIVAAAGGEAIPQAWTDQLATGGRLVAPVVQAQSARSPRQSLVVIDKTPQGLRQQVLEAVAFVPLKSGVA